MRSWSDDTIPARTDGREISTEWWGVIELHIYFPVVAVHFALPLVSTVCLLSLFSRLIIWRLLEVENCYPKMASEAPVQKFETLQLHAG